MNWGYISGFFDADGSITLAKNQSNANKTIQLSFHNNEIVILEEIRNFIQKELGLNGVISIKRARKISHQDSYDLKYVYKKALIIANNLNISHPKKIHRIKVYNEIQNCTIRNGKYTKEQFDTRGELERLFFEG